jgi:hypothetical protein
MVLVSVLVFWLNMDVFSVQFIYQLSQLAGYWFLLVTFLLWVFVGFICLKGFQGLAFLKRHRWGLLCAGICAVFLHLHEPHLYKTLYDEYVYVNLSQSMHTNGEVSIAGRAHYLGSHYFQLNPFCDKRAAFFPFVISLLHDLTGYRVENGLILNAILTPLLLFAFYLLLAESLALGVGLAILGVILLSSLPLLAQMVTGGGYEILNLLFIFLFWKIGTYCLDRRTNLSLLWLVLTGILLGQVRVESGCFLVLFGLFFLRILSAERPWKLPFYWMLVPLLAMPIFWPYRITHSNIAYMDGLKEGFFSLSHLSSNISHALYYLFNFEGELTNNPWLMLLGSVAVLFVILRVFRAFGASHPRALRERNFCSVGMGVFLCLTAFLTLCSHWGQWDAVIASRFSINFQVALILAIVVFLSQIPVSSKWKKPLIIGSVLHLLVFSGPASARHFSTNDMAIVNETEWILQKLEAFPKRKTLIISQSASPFICRDYAALPISLIGERMANIAFVFKQRHYETILITERFSLDFENSNERKVSTLPMQQLLILETLYEDSFRPGYTSRISKVVGINPDFVFPEIPKDAFTDEQKYSAALFNLLP